MKFSRSVKSVVVLLLVAVTLSSSKRLFRRTPPIDRAAFAKDPVTAYVQRFDGLKVILPARGVVGYEGDSEDVFATGEAIQHYYLTQYALAPLVVASDPNRDLVVANLRAPGRGCKICSSRDFALVRDFGNGVMLFRRSPQ